MYDKILKNARILDGRGNPFYYADIGIVGNKIATIGKIETDAAEIFDLLGLYLAPGFVDSHSHTDFMLMKDSLAQHKLSQGVTSEVCGQCGITFAPISAKFCEMGKNFYGFQGISLPDDYEAYTTYGKWLDTVERMPLGINEGFLVGHGAIRMAVMGLENRKATSSEMSRMKEMLREAMSSGALGMSSGLKYAPGVYASNEEIVELCQVLAESGGCYASHIRNQSSLLRKSVEETIDIGRKTGVPVIISHHKALGKPNWGAVHDTLQLIHQAVDQGIVVGHDVYPYIATSTTITATLPPSVLAMEAEKLIGNLSDPSFLEVIHQGIFHPVEEWDNDLGEAGYDAIRILSAPNTPVAVGKSIAEYAAIRKIAPFDAYIEILRENALEVYIMVFSISEEDMETVLCDPFCMIGSDSNLKYGDRTAHPRSIGTFPRILGRYVREKKILTLEDAIRKMTSLTAQQYHIKNKGTIVEGYDADLVAFNRDTVCDQSVFQDSMRPNCGIEYVFVNGRLEMKGNQYTGTQAGRLIRGGK